MRRLAMRTASASAFATCHLAVTTTKPTAIYSENYSGIGACWWLAPRQSRPGWRCSPVVRGRVAIPGPHRGVAQAGLLSSECSGSVSALYAAWKAEPWGIFSGCRCSQRMHRLWVSPLIEKTVLDLDNVSVLTQRRSVLKCDGKADGIQRFGSSLLAC